MASRDPEKLIAKADKLTRLTLTRWTPNWADATRLYEDAANGFWKDKNYEQAKAAFEKASEGEEKLSSPWDAAKHMQSAASMAKELRAWREVADLYRRASVLYIECGRAQPASDALAAGARALEEEVPDEAVQLYTEACAVLEEDEKERMAFDLYRCAAMVYINLEKYADAAAIYLRWALVANKCSMTYSQCKAYLSAIIVHLYVHDFKEAEKCYNDCRQVQSFLNSDQQCCASKFLSAYMEGDEEEIKRIGQSSIVSNLDNAIVKLARKLPTGDVSSFKHETTKGNEEPLDEDDLT